MYMYVTDAQLSPDFYVYIYMYMYSYCYRYMYNIHDMLPIIVHTR